MSSTFGEKKRTSGPFGSEGIAGGPLSYSFLRSPRALLVGFVLLAVLGEWLSGES